ncbi:MAG: tetratricopeptide repeat protein [Syntrophobacteraceae bacterium]
MGKIQEYSLRVLAVDDHPSMRSILRKMLYQMRYFEAIEEAIDGEEAWEKMQVQSFHLVITDVNMPRLDGGRLLRRCRSRIDLRDVPFLIISGESIQDVVALTAEWGAYDYLVKPFSYTELKKRVDAIFAKYQDPEEALFREIEKLKEQGYWAETLEKIGILEEKLRDLKPRWLNLKGECLLHLNQPEQAEVCFQRAIGKSEIFLPAYKNYAALKLKLGDKKEAINLLEVADRLSPLEVDRKIGLGRLLFQDGREEDGKACLEKAAKIAPQDEKEAYLLKVAEAYMEAECFNEAEELFVKVLKDNPNQVETYNRLGIALRRQGKLADAERFYSMALKSHPHNAAIHFNLGVLQLNRQEKEKARHSFKEAVRLDPGFKKAAELLAKIDAS